MLEVEVAALGIRNVLKRYKYFRNRLDVSFVVHMCGQELVHIFLNVVGHVIAATT